jgi:hypothetical protein
MIELLLLWLVGYEYPKRRRHDKGDQGTVEPV